MTPPQDPRKGLPSASALYRLFVCPGSHKAQQGLADEPSEDAARGTRIHRLCEVELCVGEVPQYSEEEIEVARMCLAQRDEAESWWRQSFGLSAGGEVIREKRLWLLDENGVPVMSGQADYMVVSGDHGLILDYKTGRIPPEPVERNMQLRGLVALMGQAYPGLETVTVGIVQPLTSSAVAMSTYGTQDIEDATVEALALVNRAMRSDAPRSPDAMACKYCKARTACPALQSSLATVNASEVATGWATLPAEKKVELYDLAQIAKLYASAVEKAAKADLNGDPESIPGLTLKPGNRVRKITDVQAAWDLLSDTIGIEGFLPACSVSIPALEKAVKDAEECTAKEAKQIVNDRLQGVIERKQNAPSVARDPGS